MIKSSQIEFLNFCFEHRERERERAIKVLFQAFYICCSMYFFTENIIYICKKKK